LGELAGIVVEEPLCTISDSRSVSQWGESSFHLADRITTSTRLCEILPELARERPSIEKVIARGYKLSLLPLNCLLGPEVYRQFVPPADFYQPHPTKSLDPYGIYTQEAGVLDVAEGVWLGARKFRHTLLVNVHGYCPMGCSDCYKSCYTREKQGKALGINEIDAPDTTQLTTQMRRLVAWLNETPEVYDVIISGGEPLIRPNSHIRAILSSLQRARHLRVLRFCTGTLFLGLPFRFTDDLLELMQEFQEETGIGIRIHAHLSNWLQISPEALIAVARIRQRGIAIYTQVPIREGLNFFRHDPEKTLEYFVRLGRFQAIVGVEPYMFIADMHPRTNHYYVAIEPLLRLWCRLVESHTYPGTERPRSLSILFSQGNIVVSGALLLAMRKSVDADSGVVTYKIPTSRFLSGDAANVKQGVSYFTFREPLIVGENDNPSSLAEVRDQWREVVGYDDNG
jgi:lysine 2,3-aminomutase